MPKSPQHMRLRLCSCVCVGVGACLCAYIHSVDLSYLSVHLSMND